MSAQAQITQLLSELANVAAQSIDLDSTADVSTFRALLAEAITDAGLLGSAMWLQLGDQVLDLKDPDNGFIISTVDFGYAPPRIVSSDNAGQDGSNDQTKFFGTRVIQLSGAVTPTAWGASRSVAYDQLAPFAGAGTVSTLFYAMDDDIGIRAYDVMWNQEGNPIDHPVNATAFAFQLRAPNPISYDPITNFTDVAFVTLATTGRTYPRTYPLTYTSGPPSGSGSSPVVSGGTYPTWPVFRIFGPCTNPAVYWLDPTTNDQLNIQVVFSGLTVNDGDYVEVDTRNKTALLNGSPDASRYNFIDFVNTNWGPLQPGTNLLSFDPATAAADCICRVLWRDNYRF